MNKRLPEGADDVGGDPLPSDRDPSDYTKAGRLTAGVYEAEMERLQEQLVPRGSRWR